MGAKLTGTLVAANLVAVSGLAGLQLYGAIQSLDAEAATPQIAFLRSADQPAMATAADYPAHPVRVTTRDSNDDGARPILVTLAGPGTTPEVAPAPTSDQPTSETPTIAAALVRDDRPNTPVVAQAEAQATPHSDAMMESAEDLGQIITAAGPAHAMIKPDRIGQGSPQEAWQALPRVQVAYRARLIEASPGSAAKTETVTSKAATPKTASPKATPETAASKSTTGETAGRFVARLVAPDAPGADGYVIVASYGTRESAAVEAARFGHWQPTIMPAKVKGKDYFRVAIGPFTKADLKPALQAVIGDGAAKAWPLITKPASASAKAG